MASENVRSMFDNVGDVMHKCLNIICISILIVLFGLTPLWADDGNDASETGYPPAGPAVVHKIAAGATYHNKIPDVEILPYKNGDLSYDLMYEYHEGVGYWQLGASYAPGPSDKRFDYVVTPKLSLILKDRIFRIGVGAMKSYVKTQDNSDWTSVYWQACAGLGIPLGKHLGIDLYANYLFTSWGKFTDLDTSGLEYTALISVGF